ncbi:MAG: DUF4214 domain-containing protein [Sulfitobacter sp.]
MGEYVYGQIIEYGEDGSFGRIFNGENRWRDLDNSNRFTVGADTFPIGPYLGTVEVGGVESPVFKGQLSGGFAGVTAGFTIAYRGPEITSQGAPASLHASAIDAVNFDYNAIASAETDGDDVYYASGVKGSASLGDGNDQYFGSAGENSASGGAGNDTLTGEAGDDNLNGNAGTDNIDGGSGDDVVNGGDDADILTGGPGDDMIDGGGDLQFSIDTAIMDATFGSLTISLTRSSDFTVTDRIGNEGTDNLREIEVLQTGDFTLDMSKVKSAGFANETEITQIAELYLAYFNRAPDSFGLIFWIDAFRNREDNFSLKDIAEFFFDQPETKALYENVGDDAFVQTVYLNVLGRVPDGPGLNFWSTQLSAGTVTRADFILELLAGARANPDGAADVAFIEAKTDIGIYFSLIQGQSNRTSAISVMEAYDGTAASLSSAKALSDSLFAEAQTASDAVLMPLVGVIDDPFMSG